MNVLHTQNMSIGYSKTVVQSDLNLKLHSGELICLIGTNGCGKSTLLRTLSGIQKPLQGDVFIQNENINVLSHKEKSQTIALVLTNRPYIEYAKVIDVVKMGQIPFLSWYQKMSEQSLKKVDEALEMVRISHKKDSLLNEISDGEFQRVMIAKALAQDTPVVFLDEPTSHLDLPNRVEMMILLKQLAQQTNKAIIVATHELNLALQTADKIWLMHSQNGGVEVGTPNELVRNGSFDAVFDNELYQIDFAEKGFSIKMNE